MRKQGMDLSAPQFVQRLVRELPADGIVMLCKKLKERRELDENLELANNPYRRVQKSLNNYLDAIEEDGFILEDLVAFSKGSIGAPERNK